MASSTIGEPLSMRVLRLAWLASKGTLIILIKNNMSPKDKAKQLVEDMSFSCRECDYEIRAKYSAIRAVDEIIELDWFIPTLRDKHEWTSYWQEVRKEIEKL
jgi:hypothetical protein